jgi:hypothetical protein
MLDRGVTSFNRNCEFDQTRLLIAIDTYTTLMQTFLYCGYVYCLKVRFRSPGIVFLVYANAIYMHISLISRRNNLKVSMSSCDCLFITYNIIATKCPHFAIFDHVTLHVFLGLKSQISLFPKEITVHSGIVWRDKIYGDRQICERVEVSTIKYQLFTRPKIKYLLFDSRILRSSPCIFQVAVSLSIRSFRTYFPQNFYLFSIRFQCKK